MQASAKPMSIEWIAHRGDPQHYPENSLEGFESALNLGARWMECDVQLSSDQVPMLFHDSDLDRMCGVHGSIHDMTSDELQQIPLRWPNGSKPGHSKASIQPLPNLIKKMRRHSHLTVLVELKVESIHTIGHDQYAKIILQHLKGITTQVILISFSSRILSLLKAHTDVPLGWIIPDWDEQHHAKATALNPDWLICNHQRLPAQERVWPGSWNWALYAIDDPDTANTLRNRGFHHQETNRIGAMLDAGL